VAWRLPVESSLSTYISSSPAEISRLIQSEREVAKPEVIHNADYFFCKQNVVALPGFLLA
jgi:hypothetical protein